MGADDDADCVEHVWALGQLHFSADRGVEQVESCTRCRAVRYRPDSGRASRERLRQVRAARGREQ